MIEQGTTIAVIGGTGKEGSGLSLRWARTGLDVIIGSRRLEKAERVAKELNETLGQELIRGLANRDAAQAGDIVVLSVPYAAHRAILEDIQPALPGKVLIDVTAPIDPKNPGRVRLLEAGSAAVEAQQFLGDQVTVVAAFQNIAAGHLQNLDHDIDSDVLVCGDDRDAKQLTIELAEKAGMHALDAGPLTNASIVEGLTAVLIALNKRYKSKGTGIRITGISEQ
ncbi:MAG: NADPH-dependent F420 reductase [Anaerolineae bacterium]